MTCSVCGAKCEDGRLLCAKHYSVGKIRDKYPVPVEDLDKRKEGRERGIRE